MFSHTRKIISGQQMPVKNIYLLSTHETLLYKKLKFFIPPEDSEDINSSIDMEEN